MWNTVIIIIREHAEITAIINNEGITPDKI